MDFESTIQELRGNARIENVEDARPNANGLSVKFDTEIQNYNEAVEILRAHTTGVTYSNMTGEGSTHIIILIEDDQ